MSFFKRLVRRRHEVNASTARIDEQVYLMDYEDHYRTILGILELEVEPLACPRCGQTMRIVAFITEPKTIGHILEHLRCTRATCRRPRAPPRDWKSAATTASA